CSDGEGPRSRRDRSRRALGADGRFLRPSDKSAHAGCPLVEGDRGASADLSHRHGRAGLGPELEARTQRLDRGEPVRDQQAAIELRRSIAGRKGPSHHRRLVGEAMRAIRRRTVLLAFAALPLTPAAVPAQDVPEPAGYRTENYRSPTPTTLAGARVLTTADAHHVWMAGEAVFLDVLPRPPRPANLPPGTIWR